MSARVGNGYVTLRPEPATQVDPDLGAPASARDERLQERRRQPAPLGSRQTAAVRIQDLHAHVIRAGVKVRADTADDRLLAAPCHDGVDQPVAATPIQVPIVEPEPAQAVGVVRQLQVSRRVPPGEFPGLSVDVRLPDPPAWVVGTVGLSIAKKNALLSGGDIILIPGELGGAAFRISLPS